MLNLWLHGRVVHAAWTHWAWGGVRTTLKKILWTFLRVYGCITSELRPPGAPHVGGTPSFMHTTYGSCAPVRKLTSSHTAPKWKPQQLRTPSHRHDITLALLPTMQCTHCDSGQWQVVMRHSTTRDGSIYIKHKHLGLGFRCRCDIQRTTF